MKLPKPYDCSCSLSPPPGQLEPGDSGLALPVILAVGFITAVLPPNSDRKVRPPAGAFFAGAARGIEAPPRSGAVLAARSLGKFICGASRPRARPEGTQAGATEDDEEEGEEQEYVGEGGEEEEAAADGMADASPGGSGETPSGGKVPAEGATPAKSPAFTPNKKNTWVNPKLQGAEGGSGTPSSVAPKPSAKQLKALKARLGPLAHVPGGLEIDLSGEMPENIDIDSLQDKPWHKPDADPTDYFNYGFVEDTWRLYCRKQQEVRLEKAGLSKINTFDGGEQSNHSELPAELRMMRACSAPAGATQGQSSQQMLAQQMQQQMIMRAQQQMRMQQM